MQVKHFVFIYSIQIFILKLEPPAALEAPTLSNIASRAVDLNWTPPSPFWKALAVTGYLIQWKTSSDGYFPHEIVVGNVTTTTLTALLPNVQYEFHVAALVEDQVSDTEWKQLDLYGNRRMIIGALVGAYSPSVTSPLTPFAGEFNEPFLNELNFLY